MTNNLVRRLHEHKVGVTDGFTKKYQLNRLLYFEEFNNIENAIAREKQLKHWNREWKLELIKGSNPELKDIYSNLIK